MKCLIFMLWILIVPSEQLFSLRRLQKLCYRSENDWEEVLGPRYRKNDWYRLCKYRGYTKPNRHRLTPKIELEPYFTELQDDYEPPQTDNIMLDDRRNNPEGRKRAPLRGLAFPPISDDITYFDGFGPDVSKPVTLRDDEVQATPPPSARNGADLSGQETSLATSSTTLTTTTVKRLEPTQTASGKDGGKLKRAGGGNQPHKSSLKKAVRRIVKKASQKTKKSSRRIKTSNLSSSKTTSKKRNPVRQQGKSSRRSPSKSRNIKNNRGENKRGKKSRAQRSIPVKLKDEFGGFTAKSPRKKLELSKEEKRISFESTGVILKGQRKEKSKTD